MANKMKIKEPTSDSDRMNVTNNTAVLYVRY